MSVAPQQLLRQHQPQLLAAAEETVVHPPQEPLREVVRVDQLRQRLLSDQPQPAVVAETAATAQRASAAMVAMVAQL